VEGMIVTNGDHSGGYGLYVIKGKPVFTYNLLALERYRWASPQVLTPGKHTIVFDFTYDGSGAAIGGTGVLKVDGVTVDSKKIPKTVTFFYADDETFTVSVDTRTGVNDAD
jgi:arylsulfatase